MGFAMASGLRPEQGIVGGAVAGLIGALWGGSKYQVYGPTAAFIPVIAGLMAKYNHSMLVLASLIAGVILVFFGIARLGKIVTKVPHSIVVGFTIGIAITIALSQIGEILGLKARMPTHFFEKVAVITENLGPGQRLCDHARLADVPDGQVHSEGLGLHPRAADRAGCGFAACRAPYGPARASP